MAGKWPPAPRRAGNLWLPWKLGKVHVGLPHRATSLRQGVHVEWPGKPVPGGYERPVRFVRVDIQ